MKRRTMLKMALAGLVGSAAAGRLTAAMAETAGAGTPFDFDTLAAEAEAAAAKPFVAPDIDLAGPFADLTYDRMRGIRFREERAFWGGDEDAFALDLMPPGFYFDEKVRIHLVRDGRAEEVAFSTDFFDFDPRYFTPEETDVDLPGDHGFTGLRLRHPINRAGVWDEVAVFQGASYFRAVARDTFYGLSARGLAIGTGEPEPEEFPIFTSFWVEEPAPDAEAIRLWARLDGPSVAGAYEFVIRPGTQTEMDIRLALFPRVAIDRVGIAPLTSMYFFGPESRAGIDDFRDAVHDSSGLAIVNGAGERLWRPLTNPPRLQFSAFQDDGPRRFGLLQRERDFAQYQDAEARYEMRPDAWVEPQGDWGPGAVVLVEIPTENEFADNIVAFWRPEAPLAAGRRHDFAYRLVWARTEPEPAGPEGEPLARVRATRTGGSILDERERVFVIDFDLGTVAYEGLEPRLAVSAGDVAGAVGLTRLPDGSARVGFHFLPGDALYAELRLELTAPSGRASEVWLYRWHAA
jgi:periplasmic glucans biosynthesis protein